MIIGNATTAVSSATQEAKETLAQTKAEAAKGDQQAVRKLAAEQAAKGTQQAPAPAKKNIDGGLDLLG